MEYVPHKYQEYAIDFIEKNPVSAILLDMGLGKTSITLTAISDLMFDSFDVHKVLVVAPLRVTRQWIAEVKQWDHLHDLICSLVVGTREERLTALRKKADIYITNRENVPWLVEESGMRFDFDMVVLDEMSSFKNPKSKRAKCMMLVRPYVKRITGLTGSPAPNSLMDLFSQYRILDMGKRLGRFISNYRDMYFLPDKRNGMVIYSYKPKPYAEDAIYGKVSDITISMKAKDYLKMPELIKTNRYVTLSEKEANAYKKLKDDLVLELGDKEITAANAAVLSGKLCQMANGALYSDDGEVEVIHDRKLDALEDIVEEMVGKPFLLAYWYKHDLLRIKKRLDSLNVIYDSIDDEESIRKWNNGELQVGLCQGAAVSHGLNLQFGGSTVVWFGLTFNLDCYNQLNARLYRQGQKSGTVVIQHIVTKGTIDEDILKALERKDSVQNIMLAAVKAHIGGER